MAKIIKLYHGQPIQIKLLSLTIAALALSPIILEVGKSFAMHIFYSLLP